MGKWPRVAAGIFLAAHGLVHVIGFAGHWPLGDFGGMEFTTAVLGGRWDLGALGSKILGLVWLATAIVYTGAAVAFILRRRWSGGALAAVTVVSLVVCGLEWDLAFRGGIIDIGILVALAVAWVMNRPKGRDDVPA